MRHRSFTEISKVFDCQQPFRSFARRQVTEYLKAANIMITETGSVQIIDFGVAANLEPSVDKRATFIGTMNWMAPEFFKRDPSAIQYDESVGLL